MLIMTILERTCNFSSVCYILMLKYAPGPTGTSSPDDFPSHLNGLLYQALNSETSD
jgi:hypothetical protein